MTSPSSPRDEGEETNRSSLQRSMDIFWALSNLSMEWNAKLLVSSFVTTDNQEEYWKDMHEKMAASIVETIKNIKGCWVKLGQMLSTKPGMLPKCYIDAFCQLHDGMGHSDFSEVIDTLEQEMGYMDDIFKNFDSIPIASASIAQVHKAKLHDGRVVAIKVQHKCSEQNLKNDLEILKMLTWVMQKMSKYKKMCQAVVDYSKDAMDELDFRLEAGRCKRARIDAEKSGIPIFVPKIYDKYSSRMVITMEYFKLYKMTDVAFIKENNIDADGIVYDIHDFAMYQIFSVGSFHGDPHPGNLQLTKSDVDGKFYPVLLDWGMTHTLTSNQRMAFCRLTESLYMGDTIGCVTGFQNAGFHFTDAAVFRYERFLESLLNIFSSDFNKVMDVCAEGSGTETGPVNKTLAKDKWQYQGTQFVKDFITNAPNFFPLLLKMITEYRNYAITLRIDVPLLQIIYKNTMFALHNAFYSPLFDYIGSDAMKATLLRKVKRIRHRLDFDCIEINEQQILGNLLTAGASAEGSNLVLSSNMIFRKPRNYLESKISSLLAHIGKDISLIGAAQVAVMCDGNVDADISYGYMGIYESRPINSSALFQVGAIMSSVITTAVLHLVTQEKLELDDTIAKHWPEFGKNGKMAITVRQMLNQSSGLILPYPKILLVDNMDYDKMVNDIQEAHIHQELKDVTNYAYLYYGWIMAELVRRVSGQAFEEYVLDMANTVGVPMTQLIFPSVSMSNREAEKCQSAAASVLDEAEAKSGLDERGATTSMQDIPLDDGKFVLQKSPSGDVTPKLCISTAVSMKSVCLEDEAGQPIGSISPSVVINDHESNGVEEQYVYKRTSTNRSLSSVDLVGDLSLPNTHLSATPSNSTCNSKITEVRRSMMINGREIYIDEVVPTVHMDNLNTNMGVPISPILDDQDTGPENSPQKNAVEAELNGVVGVTDTAESKAAENDTNGIAIDVKDMVMNMDDFLQLPARSVPPIKMEEIDKEGIRDRIMRRPLSSRFLTKLMKAKEAGRKSLKGCICTVNNIDAENLYMRCLFPSDACPTESRFVRHNRESFINLDNIDMADAATAINQQVSKGTNGMYKPVIVSPDDVVTDDEELYDVDLCRENMRIKHTRTKKFLRKASTKDRVVHHNNFEVVIYGCLISDPMTLEYPFTYQKSIPFLNGRSSAMALTQFFQAVMQGILVNGELLNEAMNTVVVDRTPLTKVLTAMHTPCWGLGYQRFYLRRHTDGMIILGMGGVDISGSLCMMVPELNLVITMLFSQIQRVSVAHEVLRLVVGHYGLELINSNIHIGDPTLCYRLLATIRV
ncbi:ABC1 family domain containing protein [Babesia gibsoni]|uniref:ABC1 family domain containing protein n=1 Tax=Babesia gibsoni TaxID=33632 RepID=A0AAD8PFQ8_BABGI|nr:ABC1 family domain containing protein [Babesia gibsoni]